jgi:hypothetical protein
MTALFDEPLRVTLRADLYPIETEHPVGLLLGFAFEPPATKANRLLHGIVCLADGSVVLLPQAAYAIDWRYDVENDRFTDLSAGKDDQDT